MSLFGNETQENGGGNGKSGPSVTLHFDGGSRGNPGPAGIGVVLLDDKKRPLYELGEFLGHRTNNVAEYTALVRGLTAAKALHAARVTVKADSELVVRQINGQYKVKSPDLVPLYQQAKRLMQEIGHVSVTHVYREGNTRADELANQAMDLQQKVEPLGPPGTLHPKPAPAAAATPALNETRTAELTRLLRLAELLRRTDEKLSPEQFQVLLLIAQKPGRSAAEIGDDLKRTPTAVMKLITDALITRLEFIYLDNRDSDSPEDRLFLTEKGDRFIHQLLATQEDPGG